METLDTGVSTPAEGLSLDLSTLVKLIMASSWLRDFAGLVYVWGIIRVYRGLV